MEGYCKNVVAISILAAIVCLLSIQYAEKTSYLGRLLAAPEQILPVFDKSNRKELNEYASANRKNVLLPFFAEELQAQRIEGNMPKDKTLEEMVEIFIQDMWHTEISTGNPVSVDKMPNVYLFMMQERYIYGGLKQSKRFRGVHGNQPFSDTLEYISIDPDLFHMLFPGDYEVMLHTWCNWRYMKPKNEQDVLYKSLRRDKDTWNAHARHWFHIDDIRALPDVHSHYSSIQSQRNNYIVDPDVSPNPHPEESPEYKDHERYRIFHEFFRRFLPTDVTDDKTVYPIGYLEICSSGVEKFRSNDYKKSDLNKKEYDLMFAGTKYRNIFDYGNGIFYLSKHYNRWKPIINNEGKLNLVGINGGVQDSYARNPYFRLELELNSEQCKHVWSDEYLQTVSDKNRQFRFQQ